MAQLCVNPQGRIIFLQDNTHFVILDAFNKSTDAVSKEDNQTIDENYKIEKIRK
jgi:hypothetical protein